MRLGRKAAVVGSEEKALRQGEREVLYGMGPVL